MNHPLSVELAVLRQRELQEQANARRQNAVTPTQNSLPSLVHTVLSALNQRSQKMDTTDDTAHLAWVADQA